MTQEHNNPVLIELKDKADQLKKEMAEMQEHELTIGLYAESNVAYFHIMTHKNMELHQINKRINQITSI